MISQTSLMAYIDMLRYGGMSKQQKKILHLIQDTPKGVTRFEISSILNIPLHSVCGRVKELLNQGFVVEDGRRLNRSSKKENYILKVR